MKKKRKRLAPHGSTVRVTADRPLLLLTALLATYVWIAYGFGVRLAFINDDYLFLDKATRSSFLGLWKPQDLIFGWHRPWSREFHYWALLHLAGLREPVYHLVSYALWLADMVLYFVLARRLAGQGAATIATAGVAALALWGTPILWIAGSQDLWMLGFSLLTLQQMAHGRVWWAVLPFAFALLSKETAAAVPSIAFAMLVLVNKKSIRTALRGTAGLWTTLIAWMLLHPTLRLRLFGSLRHSTEADLRPAPLATAIRTLLAQINLHERMVPDAGWAAILLPGLAAAAVLGAVVFFGSRHAAERGRVDASVAFGLSWALAGWWILFLPSIGWHAYYGCLGSLGLWLAVGAVLASHRRQAIALVMALAMLRQASAATLSWDWGSAWYQARAGRMLSSLRSQLFTLHPDLPAHSHVYFAKIPNNIGFLNGDGPALRIWYRDSTLRANYFSAYEPRFPNEPGSDYFFLFDSTRGLEEIVPGNMGNDVGTDGQEQHRLLASLFIHSGNLTGAGTEYALLARRQPENALYAAAAFEASGQPDSALLYRTMAGRALGDSSVTEDFPQLVAIARAEADSALWRWARRRSGINPNPGSSKERTPLP